MPGQIVGYVRVSSTEQNLDRQRAAIGEVEQLFTDKSSGRSRSGRDGLEALLRHVRAGDTVRVSSMDRMARSLIDLANLVDELVGRGVRVEFIKERLIFDGAAAEDPFARFQLHMLGAVAELERQLIRERQLEGIELAKQRGVYTGRARALTDEQVDAIRRLDAAGVPRARLAREYGCARRTIHDVVLRRGAYAPSVTPRPPMAGGGEEVELPL
ncbi:recombinase family protein [Yimella sp. cx-51]|uniref:recombinase family protein n=1 Tax=Yimella sp. cx-51 TaxID=2770551 RepID=UPI00165EABD7|nr:recombinase family protein [Yimella sp. cx-51]MBC9958337.1 recombinase family protein [Yimella sp. cx-51]QTH39756.1 recombinase family protein [Yimella sp. cx-51]